MKPNIDIKTIAGVGAGVALGFFVLKSKSPFLLIALGVAGGAIAKYAIKTKGEKIKDAEKKVAEQAKMAVIDIEESIVTDLAKDGEAEHEDAEKSSAEGMKFNKNVGYITPDGTVDEHDASQYMDISF
jgi:hypothetical protein